MQKSTENSISLLNQEYYRIEKWALMIENWEECTTKHTDLSI